MRNNTNISDEHPTVRFQNSQYALFTQTIRNNTDQCAQYLEGVFTLQCCLEYHE